MTLDMAPLTLSQPEDGSAPSTPDVFTAAGDTLIVRTAAYMWLTSLDGSIGVGSVDFDLSVDFGDIVDNADTIFGLTGAIDFEYERLVFQVNGMWSTIEASGQRTLFQGVQIDGDLEMDTAWLEAFGGYRFIDEPLGDPENPNASRFALDGFVGGRVTILKTDVDARAQAMVTLPSGIVLEADTTRSLDQTEAWIEPFIGARMGFSFDDHWGLVVRGDVGGFGVDGSDFSWQVNALLGYRWAMDGWNIGLFGGYRALGQDYTNGGFTWDVITHGPIFGAQATFFF